MIYFLNSAFADVSLQIRLILLELICGWIEFVVEVVGLVGVVIVVNVDEVSIPVSVSHSSEVEGVKPFQLRVV